MKYLGLPGEAQSKVTERKHRPLAGELMLLYSLPYVAGKFKCVTPCLYS